MSGKFDFISFVRTCTIEIRTKLISNAIVSQVIHKLATKLKTKGFVKICEIGIEVGTTKSLDELCMDYFICDAVFYCFGLDQELLLGPT
jgi:hypothetical protein